MVMFLPKEPTEGSYTDHKKEAIEDCEMRHYRLALRSIQDISHCVEHHSNRNTNQKLSGSKCVENALVTPATVTTILLRS